MGSFSAHMKSVAAPVWLEETPVDSGGQWKVMDRKVVIGWKANAPSPHFSECP